MQYDTITRMRPGMVLDLYVYRQRYDDEQHQLRRGGDILTN